MNALAPIPAESEVDALIGALADRQSKRRIMDAWRAGRIDSTTARDLVCGHCDSDFEDRAA